MFLANDKRVIALLLAFSATSIPIACTAKDVVRSQKHDFQVEEVAKGLDHPWGMAFLPDGGILVTERGGNLRVIRDGRISKPVAGLPKIEEWGQGGLLDVALHPDYAKNKLVYLSYAGEDSGKAGTEVLFGRFDGNALHDVHVIFRALPKRAGNRHFGSRLVFHPDGSLFVSLGERGDQNQAQNLSNHLGTIVRILPDGRVPKDNPFVGRRDAKPEIYSYGNRNVQGMALRPNTNQIWAHEHGPQGGDEVNLIRPGINYGWPVITYGVNYGTGTKIGEGTHKAGMEQPKLKWVPSIAPSGMTFYDGDKFPNWKGDLFVGALKFQLLVRLTLNGDNIVSEERMLKNKLGRIRAVKQGPDGYLYLLTDKSNGGLYRLVPN